MLIPVYTEDEFGYGPNYSPTEIGASIQAIIVGVDVGVDPFEVVDFLVGIFFFDPRVDDL